jgi:tRNA-Thr(GGU) m(6)t(6)A37 methyltransferase TsaA
MNEIKYKPIGVIHSQYDNTNNMPIQPASAQGIRGTVEIYTDFAAGLKDIEGFSHIILIYHFHLSNGYQLIVKPYLDDNMRGVFATHAPKRPNQIGLSVVKLVKLENNIIHIENVDIVNNTPLLDIKPYVPDFDAATNVKFGWLTKSKHKLSTMNSNSSFDFYF